LHSTALDDAHALASHTLPPTREPPLMRASPACEPSTVTLAAPVDAPLLLTALLTTGPTTLNADDTLPTSTPEVTAQRSELPAPDVALHCTALDDVHALASLALTPTRDHPLLLGLATPDPSTVTLAAPVDGPLLITTELASPPMKLNAAVRLPTMPPDVDTALFTLDTPDTALHVSELDDVHTLVSEALPPNRPRTLMSGMPVFDPSTVTLAEPVDGPFDTNKLDAAGISSSKLNTSVTLPAKTITEDAIS
jgi:hypothetical protein